MEKSITELKNIHSGEDIWIIASGASMEYVAPDFFKNKLSIGVNHVYQRFPCTYLVRKETEYGQDAIDTGIPLIASRNDCGGTRPNKWKGDYYIFEHSRNQFTEIDLDVIGTDMIVVSFSTITSAIHVAAYMGAANIILCGHDCGTLDNKLNYQEYYDTEGGIDKTMPLNEKHARWYRSWIKQIEPQTLAIRDRITAVYGVNIYSLNPFINLGLEGHVFE